MMAPKMGNPIKVVLGQPRGPTFVFSDGSMAFGPRVQFERCQIVAIGFETAGDAACEAAIWAETTTRRIVRQAVACA